MGKREVEHWQVHADRVCELFLLGHQWAALYDLKVRTTPRIDPAERHLELERTAALEYDSARSRKRAAEDESRSSMDGRDLPESSPWKAVKSEGMARSASAGAVGRGYGAGRFGGR